MSKETLYLKYRPTQLEDVVGQKFTTGTLKQASIADRFAHAYLFSGNKGCGKCIVGDSIMVLENGFKRIKTVVPDIQMVSKIKVKVKDESGYGTSSTGYFEKDVKTFKITTRDGYRIEGTEEHPIRVMDENLDLNWKELSKIKKGDYCAIFRKPSLRTDAAERDIHWTFNIDSYLNKYCDGDKSCVNRVLSQMKTHKVPKIFNVQLARLFGYFVAEGCFDKDGGYVSISNTDDKIISEIQEIAKDQFGYKAQVVLDKRNNVKNVVISSVFICQFLEDLGLNERSATKFIPDVVLESPRFIIGEFLRAYFEGDGYVELNRLSIGCCSISEKLIRQIHVLLLEFGIVSMLHCKISSVNNEKYLSWRVSICSNNVSLFVKQIGFVYGRKISDSFKILDCITGNTNTDIIPYLKDYIHRVRKLLPVSKNGYVLMEGRKSRDKIGRAPRWISSFSVSSAKGFQKNITYAKLGYLNDYFGFFRPYVGDSVKKEIDRLTSKIESILHLNYYFSPVEMIEDGLADVYDICKDGEDKSFIANGFVNHNTTTARILANLLTCLDPKDGKTCGKCRACVSIRDGVAMDVIELDAAANGKVEDVQQLIDGANWAPSELKRKVYIIDEAHQLTGRAISALLKIVEEPPEYLAFVFCTTEPKQIPSTILSRAQRFNFRKITSKEIVGRLAYIAKQEQIPITEPALFEIAKISRGCMRDAIVPLEQIATIAAGKEITETSVQKYFGMADRAGIMKIIASMVEGNISLVMDEVNDLVVASADIEAIAYEISEAFRSIMLLKAQNGQTKLIDLPDHEITQLTKVGESMKLGQLDKLARLFSTIRKELEFSINDRWILESTLIHGIALLRKT